MTKTETATTSGSRSTPTPAARPAPKADDARSRNVEAILDAAERLLIEVGHSGITTRRLAGEAGLNQGLVHYYFGSLDEVLLQALERFTERLIERQRAMYEAELPFIEKWGAAMEYLEKDLGAGYPKIWLELQALGWNRPEIRERVARVNAEWREVLADAFVKARRRVRPRARRLPGGCAGQLGDDVQPGDRARATVGDQPTATRSCSPGSMHG